jgi:hypothetical protein
VAAIEVEGAGGGPFTVRVGAHVYHVEVPADLAERLGAAPAEVARATLAFLLEREPPTAIMASFACSVVPRYFPEYEAALPGYLSGSSPA